MERSLKIRSNGLCADRALVSLLCAPPDADRLARIAASLGAPDLDPLRPHVEQAQAVHFGVDGRIGKCYLEFAPDKAPEGNLLFLALKWDKTATELHFYRNITHLPHAEKAHSMARHLPAALAKAAGALLNQAREGDPDGEAVVLRVEDRASARLSFDLSLADAGLSVRAAGPLITPTLAALGRDWADLPAATHDALLGHVALGADRAGAPFVTLYYGACAA